MVEIEKRLFALEKAEAKNDATRQYARDYQWMVPLDGDDGGEQWKLIKEMRDKLREYSKGPTFL